MKSTKLTYRLLITVLFVSMTTMAQSTYKTTKGIITFNASTPLENINPTNSKVNGILKDDGAFGVVMLIKEFEFSNKLMQEHFNENYMESEKYPKAYFSGKIKSLNLEELDKSPMEYQVEGKITIHNVTRPLSAVIKLSREQGGIKASSAFTLLTKDFDIKIPKIVFTKIAEEVAVQINLLLEE